MEQLQNIVSTARGLIVRWDDETADKTAAVAGALGTRSFETVDLIEQDRRDAAVSDRIASQDSARRAAWKVVEDARNQVSQAIEGAAREKWRSGWIAGLSIFRASLQAYISVDREYFSSDQSKNSENSTSKKVADAANGASAMIDAARPTRSGKNADRSTQAASSPPGQNASKSVVERTAPDPVQVANNFARVKRVERIIAEVKGKKIDYWTKLPSEPTHEELLLLEGMEHLDKMGDTPADVFVREEQVTPGKFVGDVAKGAPSKGVNDAGVSGLTDVIKPSIAGDGTLLGEPSRNALRKQINDLYGLLYPALRRLCEIRDRLLPNRQGRLHVEGGLPDAEPPLTPGVLEHQAESLMTSLRTSSLWASFGCGVLRYSACIASTDWRPPNARAITSSNHVSWKQIWVV